MTQDRMDQIEFWVARIIIFTTVGGIAWGIYSGVITRSPPRGGCQQHASYFDWVELGRSA